MRRRTSVGFDNSGFTLVEIMVAAGIVGAVTGLAVPSYTRYTARARQAEAKASLASVYSRERAFAVEAQTYTACVNQIGVTVDPNRYYAVGFNTSAVPVGSTNCGPNGGSNCMFYIWRGTATAGAPCAATDVNYPALLQARSIPGIGNPPALAGDGNLIIVNDTSTAQAETVVPSAVSRNAFVAVATGKVSSLTSMYDRWYIDQNNNVVNGDVGI